MHAYSAGKPGTTEIHITARTSQASARLSGMVPSYTTFPVSYSCIFGIVLLTERSANTQTHGKQVLTSKRGKQRLTSSTNGDDVYLCLHITSVVLKFVCWGGRSEPCRLVRVAAMRSVEVLIQGACASCN